MFFLLKLSLKYTKSINEKIWKVGEFVMGSKHKSEILKVTELQYRVKDISLTFFVLFPIFLVLTEISLKNVKKFGSV